MTEVQKFDTTEERHTFVVDRGRYFLPPLSIEDIKPISELAKLPDEEQQALGMREVLASRAACDRGSFLRFLTGWRDPRSAVESLSIKQSAKLFKAWAAMAKVTPGEFSSSAD